MSETFSVRRGYRIAEPPITVREDAPPALRAELPIIAEDVGFKPSRLRKLVCRVLRVREDQSNWSERPNIENEVQGLLDGCEWYLVYDIIEAIAAELRRHPVFVNMRTGETTTATPVVFAEKLNDYFRQSGIGWQLVDDRIQVRGEESFEVTLSQARDAIAEAGRFTATNELHQAIEDLSRRPTPDVTGAIQHAMAALECVARDVTGDKGTLGDWLKKNRELVPAPLDQAVEKVWGFASERGRHVLEGRAPTRDEAELVVHLAAAVASYLSRLTPSSG